MVRTPISSRVMPSAKKAWPLSPVAFSSGSTAMRSMRVVGAGAAALRPSHRAAAIPTRARTASTVRRTSVRAGPAGLARAGDEVAVVVSAWTSSAAELTRSAGSLASVRASAPATSAGTVARRLVIGGASATTCCRITAWGVGPVNGGCPPSIS